MSNLRTQTCGDPYCLERYNKYDIMKHLVRTCQTYEAMNDVIDDNNKNAIHHDIEMTYIKLAQHYCYRADLPGDLVSEFNKQFYGLAGEDGDYVVSVSSWFIHLPNEEPFLFVKGIAKEKE